MSLKRMGSTDFGFRWGPMLVERCCSLPGDRRVLRVMTEHCELDIYVSATGRSVRVFEKGRGELAPALEENDR